jgi:hypothetical protein
MPRTIGISGLLLAATLLAGCGASTAGPSPAASATTSPASVQPASPSPAVPMPTFKALPNGGSEVFMGTYTAQFQPALALTVGHVAELDCPSGDPCRGEVDLNSAIFVDIEFGNVHGAEVHIIRLDKVYDPASPGKQIDPPADLAAWLKALPGTAVLGPATPVMIGGVAATRFDIRTPGDMLLGPLPGGPNDNNDPAGPRASIGPSALRITVIRIGGSAVLITEWLGPENTVRDGPAALESLQPLIESITWL